jgi:hypothetical protein
VAGDHAIAAVRFLGGGQGNRSRSFDECQWKALAQREVMYRSFKFTRVKLSAELLG